MRKSGVSYEAIRLREEAALCRRLAAAMQSPLQRGHYLGWAEEYERLASAYEKPPGKTAREGT